MDIQYFLKLLVFFKNFYSDWLSLAKEGRLIQRTVSSKWKEFVMYISDFAYVNNREGHLLILQNEAFITYVGTHELEMCFQDTLETFGNQKSLKNCDVNKNVYLNYWIYQKNYWKNDRAGPVLLLNEKFLCLNQEHINSKFTFNTPLKMLLM